MPLRWVSGAVTYSYIPSFIKIGSATRKLTGMDTQHGDRISLSIYLSIYLSISVSLSTYLSVRPSYPSIHPSIDISIYGCTGLVDLGRFLSFFIYTQSVGLLGRGISPSQGRRLHTEQHKRNKRIQTSMTRMGFEPTIPVFERAKIVPTLDCASTLIGIA
jgi:hypothetical protein